MLTRIYINNYRCFVNFEYRPAQRQLILGANGSGKSSLLDSLLFLRRVIVLGHDLKRREILEQRTSWMTQPEQVWEVEVSLKDGTYLYRLLIDSYGDPPVARVLSENLTFNGKLVFAFDDGKVQLFNDEFQQQVAYPFDWHRSALATIREQKTNGHVAVFKHWLNNLYCFRINPFQMEYRAEREDMRPYYNFSNFAGWYRSLIQLDRAEDAAFHNSLRAALEGFAFLEFDETRSLFCRFEAERDSSARIRFDKLSDGQRSLICLYGIIHFIVTKGGTVFLDEPDNFIALREIQPWLSALSESVTENRGQVFIISHHPELMDQWAPAFGVRFVRDGMGPVRVKEFSADGDSILSPSEIVARGWENE